LVKFPSLSINKKENEMLDGIRNHLATVETTVDNFVNLVRAFGSAEPSDGKACFEAVLNGEKDADTIHRALSTEIAEGAFFGGVREDMLALLEKIDNIADSAKDAARFLEFEGSLDAFALSLLRSEDMNQFLEKLREAVYALGELVAAFRTGRKEMLARVHIIEEYEEAADVCKDKLLRQLFANSAAPDPIIVIQMRDFIFVADDIADNAEDASDVVLVLIAKGYV
jgi:predicted phosphate transport protein (TIGR00153 family)